MATSSNRDVKMTLSVETLGAEDIKKLQDSVAKLATEGGQAAPEFQKLADEIGRLGDQSSALNAFRQLSDATADLATKQQKAAQESEQLGAKLQAAQKQTQDAAASQRQAADALSELQTAARQTRDSLAALTAQTAEAKKADESYAQTVSDLKLKKIEQRAEIEKLSTTLAQANGEVDKAEAAEKKLAAAYEYTASQAKAAATALRENEASTKAAANAAELLGVSTSNVAAAQAELVQGLNRAGQAAQDMQAHVDKLADKQRELTEIRAFEKQAEEAKRLVIAGEYAELFDQALTKLTETKKQQEKQNAEAQWQREAFALVEAAEAAQKLKRETEALEDAKRTLAANEAFEKQYQEARKLEQSAQYVRELGQSLDKLDADQRQAADSAKQAADKISNAFKTVGVRSAEELRAEIEQVRAAMQTIKSAASQTGTALDGAFKAGQERINQLERDIREVSGTLTMADKAAGLLKNSMGQITAGNIVADGVGYLVNKVKELGVAFLGAIVDGDQMRRGLNAIYKDATVTASQIEFLRRSSSESGVAFGQLSKEFVKFSASMQLSNVPLEQSNNLFKAVTAATASLGLGTEATAGALNALGQMASKGTVSLEELRQQLGDRLPGAIGLTAQGLGITEAQLIKLVESGGLATRDFIVPFTEALGKLKGENDGLVPGFDRLKGTLTEVAQGMGDAGGTTVLTGALKVLGGFVASVGLGLSVIVEGLFLFGSTLTAIAARVNGDATAFDFLAQQLEKSTGRLAGQANALNQFLAPSEAAAASTTKHADAMTANTAEVVKSINANASLSEEQKLLALATALNADASLNASAKMVQFNVAATELISKQEGLTESYTKNAKAAKEQGDTLISLAKLTGDAIAIQTASIQAAELYSDALDKVAASRTAELAMLVAQKAELEKYRVAQGLTTEQIKVQADALDKKIISSQAETEQARQSALAQKTELFERQLAVAVLKDHSAQVDNFKKAMQDATTTLQEYERLAVNGKKSEAEITEARKAVTAATVLYKDALTDLISKTELEAKAKSTSLQLAAAQAKAGADHSLSLAAQARALGDTATAIYYEIKAREQNIATMKLEIQIRDLEAKAALATIDLKKKQLDLTTEEGRKKSEILEIEKKVIAIKLLANGATKDAIEAMEREITALRDGVDLRGQSTSSIDRDTSSRDKNANSINRQTEALKKQKTTSDGFEQNGDGSAKGTFTNSLPVDVAFAVNAKNAAGKLTAADLADAQAGFSQAKKAKEDMEALIKLAPGAATAAYIQSTNALFTASKLALEKVQAMTQSTLRAKVVAQSPVAAPTVPASSAQAPAPAPDTPPPIVQTPAQAQDTRLQAARAAYPNAQGSTAEEVIRNGTGPGAIPVATNPAPTPDPTNSSQTVRVVIDLTGGKSYAVNTASANDANQLQEFIGALQNAKRGAGM